MRINSRAQIIFRRILIVSDSVLFSFLICLPAYVILHRSEKRTLIGVLFCGILGIVLLLRVSSASRMEKKRRQEAIRRRKTDLLFLMNDEALSDLTGKKRFILIRKEHPDRCDVLEAIRRGADAIGIMGSRKRFEDLIRSYSPAVTVYCTEDLLRIADGKEPGKEGEDVGTRKQFAFRIDKYLLLGILFFIASFLFGFKIYFRVSAGLCLILACFSGFLRNRDMRKNLWIFLDNRVDR